MAGVTWSEKDEKYLKVMRKKSAWERFEHLVREREAIRVRKDDRKLPQPWTEDPILRTFRFTNIRRMDDKVSRWLLDNWYKPFKDHPNMLAAASLARFINKPESLALITPFLFDDDKVAWGALATILRARRESGEVVFNGAYMVKGNSPNTKDKITIVVDEYTKPMFEADQKFPLVRTDSMQQTHKLIVNRYGFGSFMAGQVAADLRWAMRGEWADKNYWAPVGPGSARGLARLLSDDWETTAKRHVAQPHVWLARFKEHVLGRAGDFPPEIQGKMEAMDWQSCLCEWDKHERALYNEGKPKQRYPGGG